MFIVFVRQHEQLGLGHAILCGERVVGRDPFAVLLADDFLISKEKGMTRELIQSCQSSGNKQLSVMEVNGQRFQNQRLLNSHKETGSVSVLVEKPKLKEAFSNIARIGRYILTSDILEILCNQSTGLESEIQLADAY